MPEPAVCLLAELVGGGLGGMFDPEQVLLDSSCIFPGGFEVSRAGPRRAVCALAKLPGVATCGLPSERAVAE